MGRSVSLRVPHGRSASAEARHVPRGTSVQARNVRHRPSASAEARHAPRGALVQSREVPERPSLPRERDKPHGGRWSMLEWFDIDRWLPRKRNMPHVGMGPATSRFTSTCFVARKRTTWRDRVPVSVRSCRRGPNPLEMPRVGRGLRDLTAMPHVGRRHLRKARHVPRGASVFAHGRRGYAAASSLLPVR